jgi:hypothetical protein
LSARSASLDEVAAALYTLLATNTGMAVTALILGLKPNPEISFHECVLIHMHHAFSAHKADTVLL